MQGPIENWYQINHLLRSIISFFLLEYVVFPVKYTIWETCVTSLMCDCAEGPGDGRAGVLEPSTDYTKPRQTIQSPQKVQPI